MGSRWPSSVSDPIGPIDGDAWGLEVLSIGMGRECDMVGDWSSKDFD
jgi:hypothetical protein